MNILILHPRLDAPFKNLGDVSSTRGPISPIRQHWNNFTQRLAAEHRRRSDLVTILEKPLWQFRPEDIDNLIKTEGFHRVYVPHKEKHQFPIHMTEVFYYTQTQFPWLFSIDPLGWGGGASVWPIQPESNHLDVFETLAEWSWSNNSKFDQPKTGHGAHLLPDTPFMFLPCQLPHDETLLFHSPVSMEAMMRVVCDMAYENSLPLVIKGHPVNPGSMEPLIRVAREYLAKVCPKKWLYWVEDVSIHTILERAAVTITVNSGVGFESILHGVPVITFGKADYAAVSGFTTLDDFSINDLSLAVAQFSEAKNRDFINTWGAWCYDSSQADSFFKIPIDSAS